MKKTPLILFLALIMCFSFAFVTLADTSPKGLFLKTIDNLDLDFNKKFYDKSSGTVTYQVNRFNGSSLKELTIPGGTTLECNYKLDVPGKKSAIDYILNYKNNSYQGQMYLAGDKIIFTKSFLAALKELAPQSDTGDLNKYPEYLYLSYPMMTQVWTSMLEYPNAKITEDTKNLIKFLVEAIPAEYFKVESSSVTLTLNQAGFEETVYRILEKVKNEKERFADIIVTMATTYDTTGAMGSPKKMKADIIKSIDDSVNSGTWPTREQIQMLGAFIQVKEIKYQAPVIPGGQSKFNASLALQTGTGFTGQLDISSESRDKMDNLTGTYNFELSLIEPGGTVFNGSFKGDIAIKNDTITQNLVLSGIAKKAGAVEFDIEITGNSTQKVDTNLVVNVPALTASNSMNIEDLINTGGSSTAVVVPKGKTAIIVNNRVVATDAEPFIQNGRLMVPIRFVAQSLNSEVRWIEPNVIRITRDDRVISMFVGEKSCILYGQPAKMDTVPVIKNGRTFVPVRFVAEALNCNVHYVDNKVYINTR